MQYRTMSETGRARVHADLLNEAYPLLVAYLLIENVPVESILWIGLPTAYRETFYHTLLTFTEQQAVIREGVLGYGLLVLATPTLDEAERRALYLQDTPRCAKNRRRLVAALRRVERNTERTIAMIRCRVAEVDLPTDQSHAYTGFQLMRVAVGMKASDRYDVYDMLCSFLRREGLPTDSVHGETINAKARAFEARQAEVGVTENPRRASAGATLH